MEAAEVIDAEHGTPENNLPMIVQQRAMNPYQGIAQVPIKPEQQAALEAPIDPESLDILPTGEVYMCQVHYRRKLNKVFGIGQWGLLPRGGYSEQNGTLMREYALIVNGCFVADAIGEADYHPNNDRMSYATAAEALKSNALTRLCKDLGIASECWDKHFTAPWIEKYAIQVWRKNKPKPEWRRKDAKAFWDETGTALAQQPQAAYKATEPRPSPPQAPQAAPVAQPVESRPAPAAQPMGNYLAAQPYIEMVEHVGEKSGEKDGRPWTKFDISFEHGLLASTFSAAMAEEADKAIERGLPVEFTVARNGKYWNLKSIKCVEAGGPDDPKAYPTEAEMFVVNAVQDEINW